VTQRVASYGRVRCLNEGIQHPHASYLSPKHEVSVTPLCVGWHRAIHIFYADYVGKTCKIT
jgi:hypothetical protein